MNKIDIHSFESGFWFSLLVLNDLGIKIDFDQIRNLMYEIKEGNISLIASPLDIIRKIENEAGRPLPESLRKTVFDSQKNRKEREAEFEFQASIIFDLLNKDFSTKE